MSFFTLNSKVLRLGGKVLSGVDATPPAPEDFSMALSSSGSFFEVQDGEDIYPVGDFRHAGKNVIESEYENAPIVATVSIGSGDDVQAFQTAITEAKASASYQNGDKVKILLPDNTWDITIFAAIRDPRIILIGESREGCIVDGGNNDMGDYRGILDFEGSKGIAYTLNSPALEGEDKIYINTGGFAKDKYVFIQKKYEQDFTIGNYSRTHTGDHPETLYAMQICKVKDIGSDGGGSFLLLDRPMLFDLDSAQYHEVFATDFLIGNGLMNMTIRHSEQATTAANRSLLHVKYCAEFLIKDVTFEKPIGHYIEWEWVGQVKVLNTKYVDAYFRGSGGGRGYLGFFACTDGYMENFEAIFPRHLVAQFWSRGCVIRKGTVQGGDLNMHNRYIGSCLFEEIVINDDRQPITLQGEENRDIYAQIFTNIPTEEDPTKSALGSGVDNLLAIWSVDFSGLNHGGGWFMGGLERKSIFAYCRLQFKGNSWYVNSWHDGQAREPAFMYSVPCEDIHLVGNEIFIPPGSPNTYAVVRRGTAYNENASADVHLLRNNFSNFPISHRIRENDDPAKDVANDITETGNTWNENVQSVPDMPTPPVPSLYEHQMTYHSL